MLFKVIYLRSGRLLVQYGSVWGGPCLVMLAEIGFGEYASVREKFCMLRISSSERHVVVVYLQ